MAAAFSSAMQAVIARNGGNPRLPGTPRPRPTTGGAR